MQLIPYFAEKLQVGLSYKAIPLSDAI